MNTTRKSLGVAAVIVAGFVAASFGHVPSASAKALVRIQQSLVATDAAPGASGKVSFQLRSNGDARFELTVRGLDRSTSFDVVAGDVKVGTLDTNRGGGGRLRLRSRPRGKDHMLGFDPRGATVSVRAANGLDVLTADIADSSTPPGGADIICCVPDDRGAECEDRTPAECAAQGGTPSDATSCLPNPCSGAPAPGVDIVCCIPDDSGPECEDRSVEQCAAQGGTVIDAASCIGNPCAAAPSPTPTVSATPDGSRTPSGSRTPDDHGGHGNEPGDDHGGGGHGGHGGDD